MAKLPNQEPRSTPEQHKFINILANDLGFDTFAKRNSFIELRIERRITYIDELTINEASRIIGELKMLKKEKCGSYTLGDSDYPLIY